MGGIYEEILGRSMEGLTGGNGGGDVLRRQGRRAGHGYAARRPMQPRGGLALGKQV